MRKLNLQRDRAGAVLHRPSVDAAAACKAPKGGETYEEPEKLAEEPDTGITSFQRGYANAMPRAKKEPHVFFVVKVWQAEGSFGIFLFVR